MLCSSHQLLSLNLPAPDVKLFIVQLNSGPGLIFFFGYLKLEVPSNSIRLYWVQIMHEGSLTF